MAQGGLWLAHCGLTMQQRPNTVQAPAGPAHRPCLPPDGPSSRTALQSQPPALTTAVAWRTRRAGGTALTPQARAGGLCARVTLWPPLPASAAPGARSSPQTQFQTTHTFSGRPALPIRCEYRRLVASVCSHSNRSSLCTSTSGRQPPTVCNPGLV